MLHIGAKRQCFSRLRASLYGVPSRQAGRRNVVDEALLGLHASGVSSAQKHEAALTRHEALGGIAAKHEAKP